MDIFDDDSARHVTRTSVLHGADWFFWLAILSVINSLIVYFYNMPNTPVALGHNAMDRRYAERDQVVADGGLAM